MILTLTLNPAVDVSLTTDRIIYDDRVYIDDESFQPGGKGVNIARVLAGYGAEVEAIAPFGGQTGERFTKLLAESQIPVTLVPVEGETRRNVAVTDAEGLTIKLDQRGSPLSGDELERIERRIVKRLPQASWLTLTGSLPPDVPSNYYARLIRLAREHGVKTLLDTTGEALAPALAAGPELAKPNRPEAERLVERSLLSESHAAEAAEQIRNMGARHVVLSLGSQGAVAAWEGGRLRAVPRVPKTGSPIGAGDVLGATCIWALEKGELFPAAFRWAVAAGTVAAGLPGLGCGTIEAVENALEEIEIREL